MNPFTLYNQFFSLPSPPAVQDKYLLNGRRHHAIDLAEFTLLKEADRLRAARDIYRLQGELDSARVTQKSLEARLEVAIERFQRLIKENEEC
jgi:hypothetical protein